MKNNEIIHMLLDGGQSTAIPNQIKENARNLAVLHGNYMERKVKENISKLTMSKRNSGVNQNNDIVNRITTSERIRNSLGNIDIFFSGEYFKILIDSILFCQSNFSFMIGLFLKHSSFVINHKILFAKDFIEQKSFSSTNDSVKFKLTPIFIIVLIFTSTVFGYLCGLIISWEVGLTAGFTMLILAFFALMWILMGTYCCEWKLALKAGIMVSKSIKTVNLWLKLLFINPSQDNQQNFSQLRFIYTHLILNNYSNSTHTGTKLIENIWESVAKHYSTFFIRFHKALLSQDYGNKKYKSMCCLPLFLYFSFALICLLIIVTILKIHQLSISAIFNDKLVLSGFCICSIIFLICTIMFLYFLMKLFPFIIHTPTNKMKAFLKSYNIYGLVSIQDFLLSELNNVLHFLSSLDNYESDNKTFVLAFIDATEVTDVNVLVEFCSFYQVFMKNKKEVQICFLLFIDNQLYERVKSSEEMISFIRFSKMLSFCVYFNGSDNIRNFDIKVEDENNFRSSQINNNVAISDQSIKKIHHHSIEKIGEFQEFTIQNISEFLLKKSILSDFNTPYVTDLTLASVFAHKLSKSLDTITDIALLTDFVTFFYHWPFISSWITLFVENNIYCLEKSLTLRNIYENIIGNMLDIIVAQEPLLLELSQFDLDKCILKSLLISDYIGELTIGKFFLLNRACHLNNFPMQHFLKDSVSKTKIKTTDYFEKGNYFSNCFKLLQEINNNDAQKDCKFPKNIVKYLKNMKHLLSRLSLSELSLDDVAWMISQIDEISQENLSKYQERIKDINANGLVLATCNPIDLKQELQMSFGDWHLFYTLISYLKSLEEKTKSSFLENIMQPTDEIFFNDSQKIIDFKENSIINGQTNSNCDMKSCIDQRVNLKSVNYSIWKPKICINSTTTITKDNFLSSPLISPAPNSKSFGIYSPNENRIRTKSFQMSPKVSFNKEKEKFYPLKDDLLVINRTKSLPKQEMSFDSEFTFSPQLSPYYTKLNFDTERKSSKQVQTLINDKSKKIDLIKMRQNMDFEYHNSDVQWLSNTKIINADNPEITISSKFRSYLKKNEKDHSDNNYEYLEVKKPSFQTRNNNNNNNNNKNINNIDNNNYYNNNINNNSQMIKFKLISRHENLPIVISPPLNNNVGSAAENLSLSYIGKHEPDIIYRTNSYLNSLKSSRQKTDKGKVTKSYNQISYYLKDENMTSSKEKIDTFDLNIANETPESEI